jgi:hypothetical protein
MRILVDDIRYVSLVLCRELGSERIHDYSTPLRQLLPVPPSLPNTSFVPASWSRAKIEGLLLIVLLVTALWSIIIMAESLWKHHTSGNRVGSVDANIDAC